ncbi:hemicentin-1-like isoform X1 [Planococcus citri]|uniref:hemicentin-1-like isoform X1 n=1 Tax=Planococcus citri TaxID=170843 RepID=UPI0031F966F7
MQLFYTVVFYLACLNAGNSEPYVPKNLVFVYDVINPGVDYVDFVNGTEKIYKELFQSGQKIFNRFRIIFPFKTSVEIIDDQKDQKIMEKLLEHKSTIEGEKTYGNVSRVLRGLWSALYNSDLNSLVYVFTNAKPEDNSIMYAISCAIENKMIEVGFVIQQNYPEVDIPVEYQTISLQSNGLILNVHADSQIMNFMPTLLTYTKQKVNLLTINNDFTNTHVIRVDKLLDEITIVDWTYGGVGQYITHHYNRSEYSKVITSRSYRSRHLCTLKTQIESYKRISQGNLFIKIDSNRYNFGLRVFGVSGFNFDYGFSINKINNCTNNLQKRPFLNTLNYIYVKSTNTEYGAVFKSCKIISTDNNSVVKEIPLTSFDSENDFYYGAFVPTSQSFYLQVTAFLGNDMIQRTSSIAISPIQMPYPEYEKNYISTESFGNDMIHRTSSIALSPIQISYPQYEKNYISVSTNYTNTSYYGSVDRSSAYVNSLNSTYQVTEQNVQFV